MSPSIQLAVREEFYNSALSVDQLCKKHNIKKDDLIGWESWQKPPEFANQTGESDEEELVSSLNSQATRLVEAINDKIDGAENAKDLKDLVNAHESLVKIHTNKGKETGQTVNVLVNLANRYKDND